MNFENIISVYHDILHFIAELAISTLEIVGIFIIIVASVRAIIQILANIRKNRSAHIMVSLGRALALALEFKMGAEIIKTVIVHELSELGILAVIIVLRAIMALLIHWEIKNEKKEEFEELSGENKK
jgi:uncharacterized membrane protein